MNRCPPQPNWPAGRRSVDHIPPQSPCPMQACILHIPALPAPLLRRRGAPADGGRSKHKYLGPAAAAASAPALAPRPAAAAAAARRPGPPQGNPAAFLSVKDKNCVRPASRVRWAWSQHVIVVRVNPSPPPNAAEATNQPLVNCARTARRHVGSARSWQFPAPRIRPPSMPLLQVSQARSLREYYCYDARSQNGESDAFNLEPLSRMAGGRRKGNFGVLH
ncbi:Protein of unknown function [Gryllus bimaculatus]|nr:Protein of unknown function [Gryllus bimaculatus]